MNRGRAADATPSLADVAVLAQVSQGTASNVLNHPERVSPETAARVIEAIQSLGYTPNQNARSLASGNAEAIGLVVTELANSLFADIARGAQRAARNLGTRLLVVSSDDDYELQGEHVNYLDQVRVSGLLLAPLEDSNEQIEVVRRHGRPIVLLNYSPSNDDVCRVLIDNEGAGHAALSHLIELGHKKITIVYGREELQPVELRLRGIERAVAPHPDVELTVIRVPDLDAPGGALAGTEIVSGDDLPDAILCITDLLAMAVIRDLTASGIDVPGDVAVMGCDHNTSAWGGAIPLTSVAMRGEEMGELGIELLMDEIASKSEEHVHQTIVIPSFVIPRESTIGRDHANAG